MGHDGRSAANADFRLARRIRGHTQRRAHPSGPLSEVEKAVKLTLHVSPDGKNVHTDTCYCADVPPGFRTVTVEIPDEPKKPRRGMDEHDASGLYEYASPLWVLCEHRKVCGYATHRRVLELPEGSVEHRTWVIGRALREQGRGLWRGPELGAMEFDIPVTDRCARCGTLAGWTEEEK